MRKKHMSFAVTPDQVRETVSETLRRKLQWTRCARKRLEDQYGWGRRKTESIFYGQAPCTAADLLNLMATDPDVCREAIRLTGRQKEDILRILEGKE